MIGIDLGTTNSCVAALEHGQPTVLENAEGWRTTPSVVAFLADGERLVGAAARRQAVVNPEQTITSIKRFMGRKLSEVGAEQAIVPYRLAAGEHDAVRVELQGELLAPEQISAVILAKLKADAEARLGSAVDSAVITVPAYFNDAQRQATKHAAEIAGLNVLRIVNEPTAAALAYGFGQQASEQKLLVFDLGGGTFDVSVLEIGDGVFEVLATKGDNHLGGDDFDKAIVDRLAADFEAQTGLSVSGDPAALQRLYEAAEKAKVELSSAPQTQISLPFLTVSDAGPQHLERALSRAELEELCSPLLDRLVGPTREAIEAAGLAPEQIQHVLLVGGMTRMPAVSQRVREITGRDPQRGVNPDEAVAVGAAIQAGVLQGEIDDVLLLDVTPLSLGIETKGGLTTRLIDAGTTIPARITEIFTTAEDNQPSVEVHIVQGEREMARDNRSLGRVQLLGVPPAQAGLPQIEVTFDIDANGVLSVTARDLGTGMEQALRVEASTGLGSDDIERMRQDAAAHAEADRAQRELAESRNAAHALKLQAERALREYAGSFTDEEYSAVEQAIAELRAAADNPEASLSELESARQSLEQAIQRFSERIYAAAESSVAAVEPEPGPAELSA